MTVMEQMELLAALYNLSLLEVFHAKFETETR